MSTANLHKITKKRILSYNANASEIDELVDDLKGITESYLHNNYKRKQVFYTFLFGLTTLTSTLIFFA